ncbi:MAG: phosphoribosylformylglycinamidine synthase subunit PurS [Actinobacteria bacterium]|nr:phosphoribosylformylglycinamidine synthase subunit PurS [Actinomycetota bacterium]
MRFTAEVKVMLKDGISDPQGQTIERALPALGYTGVGEVRVGKRIELKLDAEDADDARAKVEDLCDRLLANTVIESFEVEIS